MSKNHLVKKRVKVPSYPRKGKIVKGYARMQLKHRGKFLKPIKKPRVTKTFWVKDPSGLFQGRIPVKGIGDRTGIVQEEKGRILGRTSKRFYI